MANIFGLPEDPNRQQEEIPIGAIGETIDAEVPSKLRTFFTDPKNLATTLVLAAAMTSPRRKGQSSLNKGLQSGVQSLAFRGGLDKELKARAAETATRESEIEARSRAAATAEAQVDATVLSSAQRTQQSALTRQANVKIAQTDQELKEQEFRQRTFDAALKAAFDQIGVAQQAHANGLGPQPDINAMLAPAFALGAALDALPEGLSLPFEPDDTSKVIVDPGDLKDGKGGDTTTVPGPKKPSRNTLARMARAARVSKSPIDITSTPALIGFQDKIEEDLASRVDTLSREEALEAFKHFSPIISGELRQRLKVRIRETSAGVGERLSTDFLMTFGLRGLLGEGEEPSTEVSIAVPQPQNIGTAQ